MTTTIAILRSRLVNVDTVREFLAYDQDTGEFKWRSRDVSWFVDERAWKIWNSRYSGKRTGAINSSGYSVIGIFDRVYSAHRLAWIYVTGEWPKNTVDHIDGDRSNNRFSNLRDVSHAENHGNRCMHSNNTSGYTGVSWSRTAMRWLAKIKIKGTVKHLGSYRTPEAARDAYAIAAKSAGFSDRHIYGAISSAEEKQGAAS